MKLKSKSFNLMQRTDALLKMLATARGVTETEIIEEALEQFADENILTFINSMYGEKVDRDTIRADRKRNTKNKKVESKKITVEENIKNNEDNFKNQVALTIDETKEVEVVENKNDFNDDKTEYLISEEELSTDTLSLRDEILEEEKKNKDKVSESEDTKRKVVLSLDTVSEKALELF